MTPAELSHALYACAYFAYQGELQYPAHTFATLGAIAAGAASLGQIHAIQILVEDYATATQNL